MKILTTNFQFKFQDYFCVFSINDLINYKLRFSFLQKLQTMDCLSKSK